MKEIVQITWLDSTGNMGGWMPLKEALELCNPTTCSSIGRIINETDEFITLAAHVADVDSEDNDTIAVDGVMSIPKFAIVERILLRDELADELKK